VTLPFTRMASAISRRAPPIHRSSLRILILIQGVWPTPPSPESAASRLRQPASAMSRSTPGRVHRPIGIHHWARWTPRRQSHARSRFRRSPELASQRSPCAPERSYRRVEIRPPPGRLAARFGHPRELSSAGPQSSSSHVRLNPGNFPSTHQKSPPSARVPPHPGRPRRCDATRSVE
jgi:hypothetical protein